MKKSQKAIVFLVVGFMVFSAVALSLLVFLANDNTEDDVVDTSTSQREEPEAQAIQEVNEEDYVGTAVEGIDWPIVLETALTELVKEDLVEGEGTEVQPGDTVTVNYRLARADGTPVPGNDTFASGTPFSSPLASLIVAWQEGIPGMKEGGVRRLQVPSELAYGDGDLVFDVEVLEVVSN